MWAILIIIPSSTILIQKTGQKSVITLPVYGLAPKGAGPLAGTMMTIKVEKISSNFPIFFMILNMFSGIKWHNSELRSRYHDIFSHGASSVK